MKSPYLWAALAAPLFIYCGNSNEDLGGAQTQAEPGDESGEETECDGGETRTCIGPGACDGGQSCEDGQWTTCDCGTEPGDGDGDLGGTSGDGDGDMNSSGGVTSGSGGTANSSGGMTSSSGGMASSSGGSASGGAGGQGGSNSCRGFASWGDLGAFGAVPGQDGESAIVEWLSETSTLEGNHFPTKPPINETTLSDYDVIILQNLAGWSFSASELTAIQNWVRAGGGLMSLSGYGVVETDSDGVVISNQVLAFSGMSYAGTTGPGDLSGTTALTCGYCLGNSGIQNEFNETHPISAHISAVGAFWGRSINEGTGSVFAEVDGATAGAAKDVDDGRVLLFNDEWVTYKSQWDGSGLAQDCRESGDMACESYHPTTTYQVPQFWYNSIKWLMKDAECFDIDDEAINKEPFVPDP